jgi:hypothetical protein
MDEFEHLTAKLARLQERLDHYTEVLNMLSSGKENARETVFALKANQILSPHVVNELGKRLMNCYFPDNLNSFMNKLLNDMEYEPQITVVVCRFLEFVYSFSTVRVYKRVENQVWFTASLYLDDFLLFPLYSRTDW